MTKRVIQSILLVLILLTVLSTAAMAAETSKSTTAPAASTAPATGTAPGKTTEPAKTAAPSAPATSNTSTAATALSKSIDDIIDAYNKQDDETVQKLIPELLPKLKEQVKVNAKDAKTHFALFICYTTNKQYADALKEVEQATHLAPQEAMYAYYYGLSLKDNWRPVEAREVLKAVSIGMGKPYEVEKIVQSLDMSIQDYDSAEAELNYFLDETGMPSAADYSTVMSDMGYILLFRGKYADAIEFFKESLNGFPDNFIAKTRWAEALIKSGKVQEGLTMLDTVLKDSQHYTEALYYKGLALELLGKADEAATYYKQAYTTGAEELKSINTDGRDHFILSQICTKLGLKVEAQNYLANAQKLHYTYEAPFAKK